VNIVKIYEIFPTEADCVAHLERVRWPTGPVCPYCGSTQATARPTEQRHHCNACNTTFSVTVRTIFHHTHLPLQKWFLAVSLVLNAEKGLSARQLARDIEINKNTAWRIAMQIREAMAETEQRTLLQGVVEIDETYVGGKPGKGSGGNGEGGKSKRGGLKAKRLSMLVRRHVGVKNATLITDEFRGYIGISKFMPHQTIIHQVWYVDGHKHTNTIESSWALLKRGIGEPYHKVNLKHLPRHIK
jgi:transposase-like protein